MENSIVISIIIPIYNAEKYLKRAVDSIISQKQEGIEIILVDDGSTDNSGRICDELGRERNIKVIHKINGGISTARNAGIEVATGNYIAFLDADDYFNRSLFAKAKKIIKTYSVDLLDFGYKYVAEDGNYLELHHKVPKNVVLDRHYILGNIIPPYINICQDEDNFIYSYVWNKIFKKSILERNNIRFDENRRTWEDRIFVAEYLKYCNSFFSMDECLYNYVNVENSLSRRLDISYLKIIISSYYKYREMYEDEFDFDTEYVNDYWCKSIDQIVASQLRYFGDEYGVQESIIETFKTPVVIDWFKMKTDKNKFYKKIFGLIQNEQFEDVIALYKARNRAESRKIEIQQTREKLHRGIKKLYRICTNR